MKLDLTIEETYIVLQNLQARDEWLKDNPDDPSEIHNERGNMANIINKLRSEDVKRDKNE